MNSLTNRSICFACHVLVACIGTFSLPAQYFTDITPAAFGTNIFNPEWADYDNDNDLDLYLAGSIYRNDGNLTFVKVAELAEGAPHGVAWGDYDRDGDLDLAIAGDGFARIYRNDGGDVFTDINAGLTGVPGPSLAWGDYDNNGRLDLLLSGDYSTVLYHNNGDSTFTVAAGTGLPAVAGPFVWGDYDNDGWLDLLGGVPPEVYHNNHDGTFRPAGAGLLNLGGRSAAWGDYDNDGDLDVLLTGPSFPSYILKAYRNNGDGTFIDLNLTLQGTAFGDAHWVDFNNDGFSDIFVSGCSVSYCDASIAGLYRNNGLGSFVDANVGLSLARYAPSMAAWGDFDGDGDLDLLLDHLYRNNCGTSNSPPTAPSELAAEILPDNDVLLRWTRATDAETTNTLGLNYAVRIGTVPGGFDYLSPAADPVTGFRRLPERGPHQTNACWLRDVPHGTYYWSVQAIDPTLAGSRFAVESAFTVPNARPFISAVSNQVTVPGRTTPAIPFSISDVETPAGELLLSASISDTTLVPAGNVVFGGASSNRTVTLSPALGKSGTASISIAVQDSGGLTATSRFDLVVQTFTDAAAGLPAIPIGASASGDYDNDGLLDIALGGGVSDYTTIYRNRGGVFSNAISSLPNRYKNDLAWVDYNHDGYLDLTECGWDRNGYGPRVYLFQNNATNSFTALTLPGITNVADGSLAWGDYDNDGDEDLLLTGDPDTYHSSNGATKLYRSDKGVFVDSGLTFPGVCKSAAVWLDFDRDGDPDILFAGQTGSSAATGTSRLFRNDGNGSFTEAPSSLPGVSQCALAVADYDRDGYPDLVLAGLGTNSVPLTRIYRNVLLGAFTEVPTALPGVSSGCAAWGDFDNDGFPDLVITGTTNGFSSGAITRVYHNNAGASFTDLGGALPGVSGKAAA
ncbi:MAG TPA: VCBS repeat-containing protein, partial [Verrucomicrobiae bacterium]